MAIRTREKSYKAYGFREKEEDQLKELCKSKDLSPAIDQILRDSCHYANKSIENELYKSLRYGMSYEKVNKEMYIYYSKSDFYGYQRKCIEKFRKILLLTGHWK